MFKYKKIVQVKKVEKKVQKRRKDGEKAESAQVEMRVILEISPSGKLLPKHRSVEPLPNKIGKSLFF